MLAILHICGVVRSPPRVSRRALVLGAGAAALPSLPSFAAPLQMTAADGDVGSAILDAWERGDSTSSMRTLVESSAPSSRASASAVAATTAGWKGLGRRGSSTLRRCDGRAFACGHSTTSTRTEASCRTCTLYSGH
jgi:hypothetical protein